MKNTGNHSPTFLLLYVDDRLTAGLNIDHIVELKRLLRGGFEMKNLGAAKNIIGMDIHWDISSRILWFFREFTLTRF